jgi:prepilin-type N-terminal cleavage/methylation domain-containing protein
MRTTKRPNRLDAAGFTLVELLIAMAISVCVLTMTMVVAAQVQKGYDIELEAAAARNEAEFAVTAIARELRAAGANPYLLTTSPCPVAGTTFRPILRNPDGDGLPDDIRLHSDINPPNKALGGVVAGTCTESNEDVTITHDPATRTINRRDNNTEATATPFTDGVITNLTFEYLDVNRAATAVDNNVCFVRVSVTATTRRVDPRTSQPISYTVTDEVRVRVR